MFTKGPWKTGEGNCHSVYGQKVNGHEPLIAHCPTQNGTRDYNSEEVFRNALLIAAAPDLLAALERIAQEAGNDDYLVEFMRNTAKAAIAKAQVRQIHN